jgi:hypothetical protein
LARRHRFRGLNTIPSRRAIAAAMASGDADSSPNNGCLPCSNVGHHSIKIIQSFAGRRTFGEFKFVVRQLGRGCSPDISVSTQAPSSCGVRVCIETEMSYFMQTVADQMHVLSHYKIELKFHS